LPSSTMRNVSLMVNGGGVGFDACRLVPGCGRQ